MVTFNESLRANDPPIPRHEHDFSEISGELVVSEAQITSLAVSKLTGGTINTTDIVVAGVLESSNYVAGTSGWHIDNTGTAEFSTAIIRGQIITGAGSDLDGQFLQSQSVVAGAILNASITATQISGTANITGGQIATGTIQAANIQNATITASEISGTAAITGGQLATGTITATQIQNLTITAGEIANLTITNGQISGSAAIAGSKIASLEVGKLTTGTISTGTITIASLLQMGAGGVLRTGPTSGIHLEMNNTNNDTLRMVTPLNNNDGLLLVNTDLFILTPPDDTADDSGSITVHSEGLGGAFTQISTPTSGTNYSSVLDVSSASAVGVPVMRVLGIADPILEVQAISGTHTAISITEFTTERGKWNSNGKIFGPFGTAGTPTFSFLSDANTGVYRVSSNVLGLSAGGTNGMRVEASYMGSISQVTGSVTMRHVNAGSLAVPSYTFVGDTDTGMFRSAANEVALSAGGAEMFTGLNTTNDEVRILPITSATEGTDPFVRVSTTGLLRQDSSARWLKKDIKPAPHLADVVLNPVSYRWRKPKADSKRDPTDHRRISLGFIADDIAQACPEAAHFDSDGRADNYEIKAILAILAAKVMRLETEMADMRVAA